MSIPRSSMFRPGQNCAPAPQPQTGVRFDATHGSTGPSSAPYQAIVSQCSIPVAPTRQAKKPGERWWTAGLQPFASQLVHEVPHGQTLPDALFVVELPSRIQGDAAVGDDLTRQRYVGGDHQITRLHRLHDEIVGHVGAGRDAFETNETRFGDP